MTLGTIVSSPSRFVESRLKSPEKGKVKILVEYIEADLVRSDSLLRELNGYLSMYLQGDILRLKFSAKDLKIKDRIWRGKVSRHEVFGPSRPDSSLDRGPRSSKYFALDRTASRMNWFAKLRFTRIGRMDVCSVA